ncbi:UNVERIFIED_CONTAM: FAD-binding protein [Campylobacter lari]
MYKFKFADIGEGLHEGTVGDIFVKVGQSVKEGDPLFSVETDKVASEIPSPVSGIVKEIKMSKGEVIHVGQEIFIINDSSGQGNITKTSEENQSKEEEKCLVGDAPNSNALIDLSFGNTLNSKTEEKNEVKEEKYVAAEDEVIDQNAFKDEGKTYLGKVDEEFDVIVVGSGPGGYLAAEEAGKSGLKTLIVEKEF